MTFSQRSRRLALGVGGALVLALAAAPAIAADHAVSIVGVAFEPTDLTIAVGDTVTWTVTESTGEPHSATSGEPDFSGQGGTIFDSGTTLTENGDTFEHTFTEAGIIPYFCTVHAAAMRGQITVLEPGQSPPAVDSPGEEEGIPVERRIISGGILVVTLVLLFGASAVWRRMNPA
jgi:plastocyanin